MSQYKEYGYQSSGSGCAHLYIFPVIKAMLLRNRSESVLDVGCGNGSVVMRLIESGLDCYGIDASEEGIAIARKIEPQRFFRHDVSQHQLPAGLNGKVFDTLISIEVIEHLYDPRDFLQFCKQILIERNGGGNLILTTPYHGYIKNVAIAISGQYDKHHTVLWDGGHIKFWSRNTLTALLKEAGFTVNEFVGVGRIPYLWKSMIIRASVQAHS